MNKHLYRIIFNKARGLLMVVAETLTSAGKASGTSDAPGESSLPATWAPLRPACLSLLIAFGSIISLTGGAQAQVVAAPGAPKNQQPNILSSANGTPQVNIQTPSSMGVSRNVYNQFDVNQQGVILNNARNNAQTQLGGWVQGNPWLAAGTARVILNEVNSSNPSQLRGYVEVAGDRAQVVIANPAGISCDGCGFINANRATLSTGAPIVTGGSLEGYRVEQGSIIMLGAGMDNRQTDYTDIIARSVQVNAGIWGNTLKITTGTGDVSADNTRTAPVSRSGSAPAYAIDVASLGGMYAGKIVLTATESGVGVRSAGLIAASAGDVIVTVDGRLENRGRIASTGNVQLDADGGIANRGIIFAQGDARIDSHAQTVDNTGSLIHAGGNLELRAANLLNADTRGSEQGLEAQTLNVSAVHLDNRAGAIYGATSVVLAASDTIDNTQGLISSGRSLAIRDRDPTSGTLAIANTGGTVIAGMDLRVESAALSGDGDVLSQGDLAIKVVHDLINTGQILAKGSADLATAGRMSNRSLVEAGNALTVAAVDIDNAVSAEIKANDIRIDATGTLSNRGLIQGQDTQIKTGSVNNLGTGAIYGDRLMIGANVLRNDAEGGKAGTIAASSHLDIGVQTLDNLEGAMLFSAGDLAIGGTLDTNGRATGSALTVNNRSATIEALGNLALSVGRINNINDHFSTEIKQIGNSENIDEYQGSGSPKRYLLGTSGVYVFNDESDHLMTPEGRYETWHQFSYQRTILTSKVTETKPGQILAGGNIRLTADSVINDKSKIIAGGLLDGTIGDLQNIEAFGEHIVRESGVVHSFWRNRKKGRDDTGHSVASYLPSDRITEINLAQMAYEPNIVPSGSGTAIAPLSLGGVARKPSLSGSIDASTLSSLFHIASRQSGYLIETDDRFAGYRSWLGSDYMLQQLSTDPATVQKRLGDGFYEQKLIREQIAELTGRRFLDGYADDEAQYRALMNNAVNLTQALDLRPGIALTAAQMAQLTSDIVWLVEREVILPDGQVSRALVPQVYVRLQDGDLQPSGALLAGSSVNLKLSGDLTNSGTIAGRDFVSIDTENLRNLGGRIAGKDIAAKARTDLDNLGGTITAGNNLLATAGRDLNHSSTTRSNSNAQSSITNISRVAGLYVTAPDGGTLLAAAGRNANLLAAEIVNNSRSGSTTLAAGNDINLGTVSEASNQKIVWDASNWRQDAARREVGSTIVANSDIQLAAGNDLNARAASVTSTQGALVATAGRDVNITAGEAGQSLDEAHQRTSKGFLSKKTTTTRDTLDQTTALSSTFSGSSVLIQAGQDIAAKGSHINAKADTTLLAGRDVSIVAAENLSKESHFVEEKKSGLMGSFKGGFTVGSASNRENVGVVGTTSVSSGVTGTNVNIGAVRDVAVTGSTVIADQDIAVQAGRNIALDAAHERQTVTQASQSSSSGIGLVPSLSGSLTVYGKNSASQTGNSQSDTAVTSLLSANAGNLTLLAGGGGSQGATIASQGADLLAGKSVILEADRIELLAAANTNAAQSHSESKSFTIGARPAGTVGGLISQIAERALAVHEGSGNSRLDKAMALKAGYDTYKLFNPSPEASAAAQTSGDAVKGNQSGGAFGVAISIGSSKSESNSQSASSQGFGTNVQAKDIALTARETDIHLQGAKLQAENITLDAARDVLLEAAANTSSLQSDNKSSSASVGVTVTFGQQTGVSFQLGMQNAKGKANGSETVYDNTLITATDTLKIKSGNDTTLKGAQLAANQVTLDVGRNLGIETLQDLSKYESEYKSGGFGLNLCIPPLCYGLSSGSVNASSQQIKHNYQSAVGQSGIAAGDGGFDIKVGQKTELVGAAITSTADERKNHLSTGSLASRDLTNVQQTEAKASSIALTGSASLGEQTAKAASTFTQGANNIAPNVLGNKALKDGMPQSGSEQGQTLSVISPAQIQITGSGDAERDAQSQATAETLTQRDLKTANQALTNTLTLQQVAELEQALKTARQNDEAARLLAQTGQELANTIGTAAGKKFNALNKESDAARAAGQTEKADALAAEAKKWDEGGAYRVALHTLAGALTGGGIDGALGAGAVARAAPLLNELQDSITKTLKDGGASDTLAGFVGQLVSSGTAAGLGALASGGNVAGAATGLNVDVNNRLLHPDQLKILSNLAKKTGKSEADYTAVLCTLQNCDINGFSGYDQSGQGTYQAGRDLLASNPEMFKQIASEIVSSGALSGQFAYQAGSADFMKDSAGKYWNDKYNGLRDIYGLASSNPEDLASFIKGAVKGFSNNVKDAPPYSLDNADEQRGAIWANIALVAGPVAKGAGGAVLTTVGEAWEVSKILTAGEVATSTKGTISAQQMTRMGVSATLNEAELAKLGSINSLDSAAAGALRETVADSYFTRNGFTALDGKCGVNCFDGVYVKGNQVIINEVKPLGQNNTIQLNGPNLSTKLPTQMTDRWIDSRLAELVNSGDPLKMATAQTIQTAINNGTLVKMVSGINGNGMTMVKVSVK